MRRSSLGGGLNRFYGAPIFTLIFLRGNNLKNKNKLYINHLTSIFTYIPILTYFYIFYLFLPSLLVSDIFVVMLDRLVCLVYSLSLIVLIGAGRGGREGVAPPPPIIWKGGQHTLWPPSHNPPIFSFNFYVKPEKITKVPSWRVKW